MLLTRFLARRRSAARLFVLTVTVSATALPGVAAAATKPGAPAVQPPPVPYSFLLNYTDQLGVPGFPGGTGVTSESDLFTGEAELSLRIGAAGRAFRSNGRALAQDRYPVLVAKRLDGSILYTLTVFAANVGGQQVNFARVDALNEGPSPRPATLTVYTRNVGAGFIRHPNGRVYHSFRFSRPATPDRPGLYFQPGSTFNPLSVYAFSGNVFLRDGNVLYDAHALEPAARVTRSLRLDAGPVDAHTLFGQSVFAMRLKPGQRLHVDLRMPVTPVAPATPQYGRISHASFNAYLRQTIGAWAQLQRGAMGIDVPEPKVVNTFYSSLNNILMPRYRVGGNGDWVQTVNMQRYHAFWLRDASTMTHALDVVGLHRQAGQNLPFFLTWQDAAGNFISRPGQLDGFGQALWAFGDHLERTGDTSFARRAYPAVQRAMAWLESVRSTDPLHLLPVTTPGDNEVTTGHLPGNDFWAIAGVEQAVRMARRLGHPDDASRWSGDLTDYRRTLQAQVRASASKLGGFIPPSLEGGGQDWGNYWAAYPGQAFAPTDPLVTRTIAHARSEFREGIGSYGDPKMLHSYLGFRVLETQLARNEQTGVVDGFYSELAHTTSTGASFETSLLPFSDRTIDLATVPHGWWAAEYVTLLRNMLVREEGNGLVLMSAISPSWLKSGRVVAVREAPTTFGTVAFSLNPNAGGATLSWRTRLRSGTRLSWPVPAGVTAVHAPGLSRGVIHLRGRSGSIQVSWRIARGPKPTFEKTVAALLKAYKRNGGAARANGHNAAPVVSG
jgi:hypothetical protein